MERDTKWLWAKTGKDGNENWHPLILHLLDVAASADAILAREPEATRMRMAAILGMEWQYARPWLLFIIACHDLGKVCPGFQCKWKNLTELSVPYSPNTGINHAFVSQLALAEWLQSMGWPDELAELIADAVGCHHGERANQNEQNKAACEIQVGRGERLAVIRNDWALARQMVMEALLAVFSPSLISTKADLSGPDFMLLAGLTSFADWIGSNEEWFPFGTPEDCENLLAWFQERRARADHALDAIGWAPRTPLAPEPISFVSVFGFTPRPLQQTVVDVLADLPTPAILLVEAPMGEGKTEAAFFAHLELQRRFGHRGLYVALPTKATGNAMFARTLDFLRQQGSNRKLDLQLLHGGTLLNDTFQELCISGIYDPETGGEVRAGEWFTNKKRALLSEYGVGTVDQALLPILPVRHNFVRLWGLANRVVVFDEIHAYDAYTGTLLMHLLRWLLALGSSVVLLSATLPPSIRRKLAKVVNADLPDKEEPYPRLSVFRPGAATQRHFPADSRRRLTVQLQAIGPDIAAMRAGLEKQLAQGGMGLALVNTVQRAQDLYRLFPEGEILRHQGQRVGKRLADGTEVFLFHARFPADQRQKREDHVLAVFGERGAPRTGRKILIATQVAEQSLDLDFDVIATDLAPIDLIFQRAGRLWRHGRDMVERGGVREPLLLVAGLAGDEPPAFDKPLWWGSVYREDLLLHTWSLLHQRQHLTLPDEIDTLVQAVYEELVEMPKTLRERLDKALMEENGEEYVHQNQANQAIIGLPDDAFWNDPARFVRYDENHPGVHRMLTAQTRLGEESVVAIPFWSEDCCRPETLLDFEQAKHWFQRAVGLSRKGVVKKLQAQGVPSGWKKSLLLRNCFPLQLNTEGRWQEDATVRLDEDLGVVYEQKEDA